MTDLSFPPLFTAVSATGADPLAHACRMARDGCDPGVMTASVFELKEPYRTTILLRFYDGLSVKEIAGRTV